MQSSYYFRNQRSPVQPVNVPERFTQKMPTLYDCMANATENRSGEFIQTLYWFRVYAVCLYVHMQYQVHRMYWALTELKKEPNQDMR